MTASARNSRASGVAARYASLVSAPRQISLLGLPIDAITPGDVIERVFDELNHGHGGYIMTPNLDHLRAITRDDGLRTLALMADVRVADGMPLLWASRIRGTPLPDRVAGSDLIVTISEEAAKRGRSVFLLGGSPGTAERAGEMLRERFAGLEIAGTCCPDLRPSASSRELQRISAALERAKPDIVYVGLPFPKASPLVGALREQSQGAWFLGLGISFSFISGEVHRAPHWMQRAGLEWLYRLRQEPRLFRRYVVEGIPFLPTLLFSALADRRRLKPGASHRPADERRSGRPSSGDPPNQDLWRPSGQTWRDDQATAALAPR